MRIFRIIFLLLGFFVSCENIKDKHYHDGVYSGVILNVNVNWEINGNEVTVNNSLTGLTKIKCRQYADRIEYEERDGTTRVIYAQENGDLKVNDYIVLRKISSQRDDSKVNAKNDTTIHQIKKSKINSNQIQISTESFLDVFAIINNIFEEKGKTYIELDLISLEDAEDPEDTYTINIINKNKKLRTFEVIENVTTEVCRDYLSKTKNTLIDNKNRLLIKNNKNPWDSILMFTSNKGKITKVNLGCWS